MASHLYSTTVLHPSELLMLLALLLGAPYTLCCFALDPGGACFSFTQTNATVSLNCYNIIIATEGNKQANVFFHIFSDCRRKRKGRGLKGVGDRPKGSRRLLHTWWRARLCKLNPEINRCQGIHLLIILVTIIVIVVIDVIVIFVIAIIVIVIVVILIVVIIIVVIFM